MLPPASPQSPEISRHYPQPEGFVTLEQLENSRRATAEELAQAAGMVATVGNYLGGNNGIRHMVIGEPTPGTNPGDDGRNLAEYMRARGDE